MNKIIDETCKALISQLEDYIQCSVEAEIIMAYKCPDLKAAIEEMKLTFLNFEASLEGRVADAIKRRMFVPC